MEVNGKKVEDRGNRGKDYQIIWCLNLGQLYMVNRRLQKELIVIIGTIHNYIQRALEASLHVQLSEKNILFLELKELHPKAIIAMRFSFLDFIVKSHQC